LEQTCKECLSTSATTDKYTKASLAAFNKDFKITSINHFQQIYYTDLL